LLSISLPHLLPGVLRVPLLQICSFSLLFLSAFPSAASGISIPYRIVRSAITGSGYLLFPLSLADYNLCTHPFDRPGLSSWFIFLVVLLPFFQACLSLTAPPTLLGPVLPPFLISTIPPNYWAGSSKPNSLLQRLSTITASVLEQMMEVSLTLPGPGILVLILCL